MMKKTFVLLLLVSLCLSSAAVAEVTNRDMQMLGGVVVSNANDSFFFAPMEEGMTKHWGLYALSTANDKPIREISDGYPARLVHADNTNVYFLAYTDADRTIHSLYSVAIATGEFEELLTNIKAAFVSKSDEFLYVSADDLFTLRSYNLTDKKDTKIKDMSNSEKTIYDANEYDGHMYFLTKNKTGGGSEDGYEYHESSGKATNLDKPSPAVAAGLLYEGYRIYTSATDTAQIFAMKIGQKTSTRIGENYNISLSSPRFGQTIYTYNGDTNSLIGLPLDGSGEKSIALEGTTMARMVLGGSKDELLLINNEGIYSITPDLSSQTRLFDFNTAMGGQVWSHVAPAGSNAIMVFGYGGDTFTNQASLMPTGVYAFDRATGELLYSYPEWDEASAPAVVEGEKPPTVVPEVLGEVPQEPKEEGETYFDF